MKILFSLSYYLPYISGLSIYAQRLAEGLSQAGYEVEILTSQHDRKLLFTEQTNNIRITRVPYILKFHKGLFMPAWFWQGYEKVADCDCLICHLPQIEGVWLLFLAKLLRKKSIIVYHCDVALPKNFLNIIIEIVLKIINNISCFLADKVVNSSLDYSKNSPVLSKFISKVVEIYPPIKDFSQIKESGENIAQKMKNIKYKIGFVGRLSADKGIEYLLKATSFLEREISGFKVFIVGPSDAVGEIKYVKKIESLIEKYKERVVLLGKLPEVNLAYFYKNIDVLVLPSINSTEAFGMVQVEAMLCGTPVVASDLPGVRTIINKTGAGVLFRPKRSEDIAEAIKKVIFSKNRYSDNFKQTKNEFSTKITVDKFSNLVNGLV